MTWILYKCFGRLQGRDGQCMASHRKRLFDLLTPMSHHLHLRMLRFQDLCCCCSCPVKLSPFQPRHHSYRTPHLIPALSSSTDIHTSWPYTSPPLVFLSFTSQEDTSHCSQLSMSELPPIASLFSLDNKIALVTGGTCLSSHSLPFSKILQAPAA